MNVEEAPEQCTYSYDFGEIWTDEPVTATLKVDVVPTNDEIVDANNDDPFTFAYNADKGAIEVTFTPTVAETYNVPAAATFSVGGVSTDYRINIKGSAKDAPTVHFVVSSDGGGQFSRDFGATGVGTRLVFEHYKGEIVTAMPIGPTRFVKWERCLGKVSDDPQHEDYDDASWVWETKATPDAQGRISADWQYQGNQDATFRATFEFADYEGTFGKVQYTSNAIKPFFIKSIHSEDALINIAANDIFTTDYFDPTLNDTTNVETGITGPMPDNIPLHTFLETQALQIRPSKVKIDDYAITVQVAHMENFGEDVRLMCFADFDGNDYFDFASPRDGMARSAIRNKELIFIGSRHKGVTTETKYEEYGEVDKDGKYTNTYWYSESGSASDTDGITGTFKFNFNNAELGKYAFGRLRFMATTYVDAHGMGPVNSYGNYQPTIDEQGIGEATSFIALNNNNGGRYEPYNACNLNAFVNVVDVNFDVVMYLEADDEDVSDQKEDDKVIIGGGKMGRTGYVYIESKEDETGFHSGKFVYKKDDNTGRLEIGGAILIKKRIYINRWHDISFPFEVYGTDGYSSDLDDQRIKVYTTENEIVPINPQSWIAQEFVPEYRNAPGGYGKGFSDVKTTAADSELEYFEANKFYTFAADPVAEDENKTVKVEEDRNGRYFWVLFHSKHRGWTIDGKSSEKVDIPFEAICPEGTKYWEQNVFTFGNPFLSSVNVLDVTTSVGWEIITWWNAATQRFESVNPSVSGEMPPFYGYWVQFTDKKTHGETFNVTFGDPNQPHNQDSDEHNHLTFEQVPAAAKAPQASTFDMPDSYTIGIDRAADSYRKNAVSRTTVTLTDAGSIDQLRAGYDMAVSYAANSWIPEIWSRAGQSRMMFNDVRREEEVVVPLGIRIKEAGEYAIRLTQTNCKDALVQLRDLQTGAMVELQREGETHNYTFLADEGDNERFELVIGNRAPEMTTDLNVVELTDDNADMLIYRTADRLRLQRVPVGYNVEVCDVVGREVLNATVTDDDMSLQLPAAQGVYLVTVRNAQGVQQRVIKLTR